MSGTSNGSDQVEPIGERPGQAAPAGENPGRIGSDVTRGTAPGQTAPAAEDRGFEQASPADDGPWEPYRALYLHVPFCKQRCRYCDFRTRAVAADDPAMDAYRDRMVLAIRRASKAGLLGGVQTVYMGGGTPTYLGLSRITEIFYALSLSMHVTDDVECSVEANPDSLTVRMVRDLWALGVNRLSIGVQSFDDAVLRTLGRVHDADRALRAIDAAHERFANVSVDLMCGVPGQTRASFAESVRQAVRAGVTHVSVYPLSIEEGTPFDRMIAAGELPAPDDDAEAAFMSDAEELLTAAGFHRYEVASYALPGFECRHNKAYWTGAPYLGLGPGAATMKQNGRRRVRVQDGAVTDDLDEKQLRVEDVMMGMRMSAGVADATVQRAAALAPGLPAVMRGLAEKGLVEHSGGRFRPTERGWLCGNDLYEAIFELAP